MTAIRVIFDGKAFIPQDPISIPIESEAVVLIDGENSVEREHIAQEIAAYYQNGADPDDEAWGRAVATDSHRAWDED